MYSENEKSLYKKGVIGYARDHLQHTKETGGVNTTDVFAYMTKKVALQEPEYHANQALYAFDHTTNIGYASTYFQYQYSLAYAQDVFTEFEKDGLDNKAVGRRYRKTILEPSGLNSGFDKLKDFLGREPSEEAYLAMNGFSYNHADQKNFLSYALAAGGRGRSHHH